MHDPGAATITSAKYSLAQHIVLSAFVAVLLWAPFPYGSNRPWALTLLANLCGLLLTLWGGLAAAGLMPVPSSIRRLWPASLLLMLALVWAAIQMIDLNALDAALGAIGVKGMAHPIWDLGAQALGKPLGAYIAVNPAKIVPAAIKTVSYAIVFFLAFVLSREEAQARRLLWAIMSVAAVYCGLGVAISAMGSDFIAVFMDDGRHVSLSRFSASFVNPNHFATFAGLGAIIAIALAHESLRKGIVFDRGREVMWRSAASTLLGSGLPLIALVLMLLGALVLSGSRGAAFSLFVAVAVLLAILMFRGSRKSRSSGQAQAALSIGFLAVFTVVIGGGPLFLRLEAADQVFEPARMAMALSALDAAFAAPFTGNGFGGFVDYYPLYGDGSVPGLVDEAHNDYAETLADLGLVAGLTFIAAPAYLMSLCIRGVYSRTRGVMFPAIGVAASVLCGLHAFVDFSLQIPAVGTTLYAVLGAASAQSIGQKRR